MQVFGVESLYCSENATKKASTSLAFFYCTWDITWDITWDKTFFCPTFLINV